MKARDIYIKLMERANILYYEAKVSRFPDLAYKAPECVQIESDQVKALAIAISEFLAEGK